MDKELTNMKKTIENVYTNNSRCKNINELLNAIDLYKPLLDDFYQKLSRYLASNEKESNFNTHNTTDFHSKYLNSLNDFYSNITNFGYNHLYLNELQKHHTDLPLLDDLIYQTRKSLAKNSLNYNTEQFCGIATHNFQKFNKDGECQSYIITTSDGFGLSINNHAFNIINIKGKMFLADCTYSQFTKLFYMSPSIIKLPSKNKAAEPMFYLLQSRDGIDLADELLTKGYFEITPKKLKLYLDSFLMSNRNASTYLNHPNLCICSSEIPENFYINILKNLLKKLRTAKNNNIYYLFEDPEEDFKLYKIQEEDYEDAIKYLDKEQLEKIEKMLEPNNLQEDLKIIRKKMK